MQDAPVGSGVAPGETTREGPGVGLDATRADERGRATWTSFAVEGANETVFVEAPVVLSPDGANHVVAKLAGTPSGMHASRLAQAKIDTMRIEIVDARTIALVDSKKGRLVYSKE